MVCPVCLRTIFNGYYILKMNLNVPRNPSIAIHANLSAMKTMGFFLKILLAVLLLAIPLASASPSGTTTYSIVHISDTQNLATHYPETYNFTFSYLESLKNRRNISAIVLTGDLVNTWDKQSEWNAYVRARNLTTIPLYVVAGNHDTNRGKSFTWYTRYTGEQKGSYTTSLEDFSFVGINYAEKSLEPQEFATIRQALINGSHNFTIIATHYYMGTDGTLSPLGRDIGRQLIVQPTLILAGHIQGSLIRVNEISGYPVIEDLTDYQNGEPGFFRDQNYAAGTLYTVTVVDGRVVTICSETIRIFPEQSFDTMRVLYDTTGQFPGGAPAIVPQPCNNAPFGFFDLPARLRILIDCGIQQIHDISFNP
jgi:predicted MPP superfamily phosphohydrolase